MASGTDNHHPLRFSESKAAASPRPWLQAITGLAKHVPDFRNQVSQEIKFLLHTSGPRGESQNSLALNNGNMNVVEGRVGMMGSLPPKATGQAACLLCHPHPSQLTYLRADQLEPAESTSSSTLKSNSTLASCLQYWEL